MNIRFLKISFKDGKVFLKYEQENPQQESWDEYQMRCADKPLPSFELALTALAASIITICEFAAGEDPNHYRVTGVSLSWSDDIMGAVITAQKLLANSDAPLNINTPHKPSEPYSETGGTGNLLDGDTIRRLETLIEEAHKYLNGDRAQMSLPFGDEKKEAA